MRPIVTRADVGAREVTCSTRRAQVASRGAGWPAKVRLGRHRAASRRLNLLDSKHPFGTTQPQGSAVGDRAPRVEPSRLRRRGANPEPPPTLEVEPGAEVRIEGAHRPLELDRGLPGSRRRSAAVIFSAYVTSASSCSAN